LTAVDAYGTCRSSGRQSIEIFQYAGTRTEESKGLFDVIRAAIKFALEDIRHQIEANPDTNYIGSLTLEKNPPDQDPITGGEAVIWETNHRFLLIRGIIISPPGAVQPSVTVMSRIYIGGLRGSLQSDVISFKYSYSVSDLVDFAQVITPIIDYVLAMDAKATGCEIAYKNFITWAAGAISKVPENDPSLISLKEAISRESTGK
jgi:hypothetical protein